MDQDIEDTFDKIDKAIEDCELILVNNIPCVPLHYEGNDLYCIVNGSKKIISISEHTFEEFE